MTESSSVIRSKSVIEKFLEIERVGGGVSPCGKQNITIVISKFVISAGQSVSCDELSIATFNPRFQTKLLKLDDK